MENGVDLSFEGEVDERTDGNRVNSPSHRSSNSHLKSGITGGRGSLPLTLNTNGTQLSRPNALNQAPPKEER